MADKKTEPTKYVILAVEGEGDTSTFSVVGGITNGTPRTVEGATRQQAIKEALKGTSLESGRFIAVPARSFRAMEFKVEKVPVENFTDVTL